MMEALAKNLSHAISETLVKHILVYTVIQLYLGETLNRGYDV